MITLDGQDLFGEQQIDFDAGSIHRDSIEKAVPGLDGILSIDSGTRGRKIKQTGVLRTKSSQQMDEKIKLISAYIDGGTHTLKLSSGDLLEDLRMDSFKVGKFQTSGAGVTAQYEIVYTQLAV